VLHLRSRVARDPLRISVASKHVTVRCPEYTRAQFLNLLWLNLVRFHVNLDVNIIPERRRHTELRLIVPDHPKVATLGRGNRVKRCAQRLVRGRIRKPRTFLVFASGEQLGRPAEDVVRLITLVILPGSRGTLP
jgi:hypothetical protein